MAGVVCAHKGQSMAVLVGAWESSPCTTSFITPMALQTTSMLRGCMTAAKTQTPTNSRYTPTRFVRSLAYGGLADSWDSYIKLGEIQCFMPLCAAALPGAAPGVIARAVALTSKVWRLPSLPSTTKVSGTTSPSLTWPFKSISMTW